MGSKKILIVYNHRDFIGKVLSNLFPTRFSNPELLGNMPVDIIVSEDDKTIQVSALLGLNECRGPAADEVYVESSLVNEATKNYIHNFGAPEENIHIIRIRDL